MNWSGSWAQMPGIFLGAALWALWPGAAPAHDGVHVSDAWARFLTGESGGQVYLTIENHQAAEDRLVEAFSRAGEVEVRGGDGDTILIPAGKTVHLQEGGSFLAFTKVVVLPQEGESVPLTLVFERAGEVTLDVTVDNAR